VELNTKQMTEKKLFTVTDLGGGDGGKGGIVHKICVHEKAHTVIKVGGAQGSHGVRTTAGYRFNFSQFGCGTFEGSKTYISKLMVIEPYRLLHEAELLKYSWGIKNIFEYLTVDREALCITPFHTIASRLRELARKDRPKGTVGIGGGEAVNDAERFPELCIRAGNLQDSDLSEKLQTVRKIKQKELSEIISNIGVLWEKDKAIANELIELLEDDNFVDRIVGHFRGLASMISIVDTEYLKKEILSKDGTVVVESSHGILTDKYYGFHPHTSTLRTIPNKIIQMLTDCDYDGEIFKLGVTRAYQIRHGAGPMVTEDSSMLETLLPGSNKDENRWQGKVRVGPLDLVMLKYSIDVCGGSECFDGLAISWFDQIQKIGKWDICTNYAGAMNPYFFLKDNLLKVRRGEDDNQLEYQQQLGEYLRTCLPELMSYSISPMATQAELIELCSTVLEKALSVPVRMISFGSTEDKKICI
jgi:adenylosuccinate synthase